MLEQEIKLAFESPEAARLAVTTTGGRLVVPRRLIEDRLFDTPDRRLRLAGTTCRLRREPGQARLTFKGPSVPGVVKTREETETTVGDADQMERILGALGLTEAFRAEKYREEYTFSEATVTVDETPVGVFVEIEATPERIEQIARRLARTPADYRLESYPRLYADWCAARGLTPGDMTFR
jgi:adenylate cyclase class 2